MPSSQPELNSPAKIPEACWLTYFRAAVFLLPALGTLSLTQIFIVPKLKQICADTGAGKLPIFGYTGFFANNWLFMALALAGLLGVLEWLWSRWPAYRRFVVGTLVFCLNSAVLGALFGYLVAFGMVMPALTRR